MDKRERLAATFAAELVDRPPVALWRHFPGHDLDPVQLAAATAEFQRAYDFDFVKVTPAGGYSAEMFGGVLAADPANPEGARRHLARVINDWPDWRKLQPLRADNPVIRRERSAVQRLRQQLGWDAPVVQTIFTPLSVASRLAGRRWLDDLREHPEVVLPALEVIADSVVCFAQEALAGGADAFFLADQVATSRHLTPTEHRQLAVPGDLALIDRLAGRAEFIILHAHGDDIYFDDLAAYPVQAINWHDRRTPPSLAEAQHRFRGAVAGGVDDHLLRDSDPVSVQLQAHAALAATGARGLILATGCVLLLGTPTANIRAVRAAVE